MTMNYDAMIPKLLAEAKAAGITEAEAYIAGGDSFRAASNKGEVISYSVRTTKGVSFRGIYKGRMGYCATEILDEKAIPQLIDGVKESADLMEDGDEQEIYPGDASYPEVISYFPEIDKVTEKEKLTMLLDMEKVAELEDPRIVQVGHNTIMTAAGDVRIVNSHGLDVSFASNYCGAYMGPVAKEGDKTADAFELSFGQDFKALDLPGMAQRAARKALYALDRRQVKSGSYPVILHNEAMADLLETFAGSFSAENAQNGLSLLKGKEGETIAADCVTLMDDPLRVGGLESRPFDDEGVACKTKAVISAGKLTTLLHNRKTAKKDGVESTGNASKAGYAAPVKVAPTNFFIKPGEDSLDDMMAAIGEGLVITELEGLHSGANGISGDFSLSAKGYKVENGAKAFPVSQITIAGNFFEVLKQVRNVGSDLRFPMGGVGSPSVDVGMMSIAGM